MLTDLPSHADDVGKDNVKWLSTTDHAFKLPSIDLSGLSAEYANANDLQLAYSGASAMLLVNNNKIIYIEGSQRKTAPLPPAAHFGEYVFWRPRSKTFTMVWRSASVWSPACYNLYNSPCYSVYLADVAIIDAPPQQNSSDFSSDSHFNHNLVNMRLLLTDIHDRGAAAVSATYNSEDDVLLYGASRFAVATGLKLDPIAELQPVNVHGWKGVNPFGYKVMYVPKMGGYLFFNVSNTNADVKQLGTGTCGVLHAIEGRDCPPLIPSDTDTCDQVPFGALCESDGECGGDKTLNNCGAFDVYLKSKPPTNTTPGVGVCGSLHPEKKTNCPKDVDLKALKPCDQVSFGSRCKGDGACDTNPSLKNCGSHSIYVKTNEIVDGIGTCENVQVYPPIQDFRVSVSTESEKFSPRCGKTMCSYAAPDRHRRILKAGSLTGGTLTDGKATGGTLTGDKLSLSGGSLTGGTLTDGKATGGTLTDGKATGGTLTDGKAVGGTLTGEKLSLSGGSLTGGTLTDGKATGGTLTNGKVTGGTLTDGKATDGKGTDFKATEGTLAVKAAQCPLRPGSLAPCDQVGFGQLCKGEGECGTNTKLNNCDTHDVYSKTRPSDDGTKECGFLMPILPRDCRSDVMKYEDLVPCDKAPFGTLCEGDGECDSNPNLNNCGAFDVYTKIKLTLQFLPFSPVRNVKAGGDRARRSRDTEADTSECTDCGYLQPVSTDLCPDQHQDLPPCNQV